MRMTKTQNDPEYMKKWREAHPGYFKEYYRRRREGLPPPLAEAKRTYRGKPVMTEEERQARRQQAAARRAKERDERHRARVVLAKNGPCADCGIAYPPYVMQFDHVRGMKLREIAKGSSLSAQAFAEAIAKCDLVCANCHARRTWQRRHMFDPFPLDS